MKFPNRVRESRLQQGISREELARLIGVTRQSVGLIEAGRVSPNTVTALRLARVLGCSVENLFSDPQTTVRARWIEEPSLAGASTDPSRGLGGTSIETSQQGHPPAHESMRRRAYISDIGGELIARPADVAVVEPSTPVHGIVDDAGSHRDETEVALLQPPESIARTAFISGCDPGLGLLAQYAPLVSAKHRGVWFNVSNQRALQELEKGVTHIAAIHYSTSADASVPTSDDTSTPTPGSHANEVNAIVDQVAAECNGLPHRSVHPLRFFHLASLQMGWVVAKGNPKGFRGAEDLASGRLRIVNREPGSGARAVLDRELRRHGVQADQVVGYTTIANGHVGVAATVAYGCADVGVAHASAAAMYGLDFLPIQHEVCVLAIPQAYLDTEPVQVMLQALNSDRFRTELAALGPYDVAHTGAPASPPGTPFRH
jgi:putative molybdopterin biosynthesis protein